MSNILAPLSSTVAHSQSQRSGVCLPHTPDRWRRFLPAPAALHPVTLPAGAAGLHRLDPRHRPTDWSDAQNTISHSDIKCANMQSVSNFSLII